MAADIDRAEFAPTEPSIAEMTAKAIEILSQYKRGFFLMVEGSQVDWAGHANDPIYMITDMLAFDAAVREALDFAEEDRETLVVVFPDHNTGAMSIGHQQSNYHTNYTQTTVEDLVDPLRGMRITASGLTEKMDEEGLTLEEALLEWWGITATPDDLLEIADRAASVGLGYAISEVISKNHTILGWTTHGHTGEDVPLWSYTSMARGRPVGLFDNTELAGIVADCFKFDLPGSALWDEYPDTVLDTTDQTQNPVADIGDSFVYPVSKDYKLDPAGNEIPLNGITVYAPRSGMVYIPK
jgi:alkaline phosphatase